MSYICICMYMCVFSILTIPREEGSMDKAKVLLNAVIIVDHC